MNITCNIIRDILPLYAEEMVSDDTKNMVEEHLTDCPDCTGRLERIRQAQLIPVAAVDADSTSMKRVGKAILKRRWTAVTFAALLALTVSLGLYLFMNQRQYISFEDAVAEVVETEDRVEVKFTNQMSNFVAKRELWPDEEQEIIFLICYTTRWDRLTGANQYREDYTFSFPKETYGRLCYEGAPAGEGNKVIWGEPFKDVVVSLPRLAMHYYFLIAVLFGVILLIPGFILRRKTAGKVLQVASAFFWCYAVSSFTIAWGDWRVYDDVNFTVYFFSNILLAVLLWLTLLTGMKLRQISRRDEIA